MNDALRCVSPVDGRVYAERAPADATAVDLALRNAAAAQRHWARVDVEDRCRRLSAAVDAFVSERAAIATELTWQMGRPSAQAPSEVAGFEERARAMLALAPAALADVVPDPKPGFERFVRREPLGVVAVVAPWNYPYLTAVNAVVPALAAGNAVLLKHSHQTPLCAERFAEAFERAGLPPGLFQVLHLSHAGVDGLLSDARVAFCAFTGSVTGGHAVVRSLSNRFAGAGLELGGKDPAYVRPDADLAHAAENLVDGSFFNAGQSCCGVERIYVHADVYDDFVQRFVATTRELKLGDPTVAGTTLGPMVRLQAADFVRQQVAEAIQTGARFAVDPTDFEANQDGTPYLGPAVLLDVEHSMRVMTEETFGPVAAIMKVAGDDEAVRRMNDSDFGLTASIWTRDVDAALRLGTDVQTGTWFMNRCDYLDPMLAWTGVKDSGRGCTLSSIGYEQLTRPKSFHLRTEL